jgi:hypothetical protein
MTGGAMLAPACSALASWNKGCRASRQHPGAIPSARIELFSLFLLIFAGKKTASAARS